MSLEQYKDANRKELWEILQIQVERIIELEARISKAMNLINDVDVDDYDVKEKRITELEKELSKVKAYKAQLLAHVKYTSTQEEVEIIKLEQQAKGIEDVVNECAHSMEATQVYVADLDCRVTELREQAKALKEN